MAKDDILREIYDKSQETFGKPAGPGQPKPMGPSDARLYTFDNPVFVAALGKYNNGYYSEEYAMKMAREEALARAMYRSLRPAASAPVPAAEAEEPAGDQATDEEPASGEPP